MTRQAQPAPAHAGASQRRWSTGCENASPMMAAAVASVAVFWLASSWGYYALADALGVDSGYDGAPVVFAAYYLTWTAVALFWFRRVLSHRLVRAMAVTDLWAMTPVLAVFALFIGIVLPSLPEVSVWRAPSNPPEFMFASGWYYLPKSADILFQQVLVASMILTAAKLRFSLTAIAIGLGLAFGGFHLLLALYGFTPLYVARFTLAASLFGLVAPYLYLRTQGGFRWAYSLHWSFYALDATVTHFVLAVPPWA